MILISFTKNEQMMLVNMDNVAMLMETHNDGTTVVLANGTTIPVDQRHSAILNALEGVERNMPHINLVIL